MITLPDLTPEERAYLQSAQHVGNLQTFAERLRQKLIASLGQKISVSCLPDVPVHAVPDSDEPVIEIGQELADAWLNLRYGGGAETKAWQVRDASLLSPFVVMVRYALAETVFNSGENSAWPQAMCLQASIGPRQGRVNIFWNSVHAITWARHAIREKK